MKSVLGVERSMFDTKREACVSADGKYRYWLSRNWGPNVYNRIAFILLNPSTADSEVDDPTVRKLEKFAKRDGYDGLMVYNLFALRATDPRELRQAADPVGPENNKQLWAAVHDTNPRQIVVAWGNHGSLASRANDLFSWFPNTQFMCFGQNKDGSPKHPLYLRDDTALRSFIRPRLR